MPSDLKLDFTTTAATRGFSIDFTNGSTQYPLFLKSVFNDIFMVFLDGKNIAFDHLGRAICVGNNFFKIENVHTTMANGELAISDTEDPLVISDTEELFIHPEIPINGFTPPLRAQANLAPGKHSREFVIVDIRDAILNSSVFLTNLRFRTDSVDAGARRREDLIADQAFTVPDTLPGAVDIAIITV